MTNSKNIISNAIYILVEGSPSSPEISFLNKTVREIFRNNQINYEPRIIEVGGSDAFSYVARIYYNENSQSHQSIPVLAITDSDYRVTADKQPTKDNAKIIENKNVKNLYWQRHEWENYLLDETQVIAEFVNMFPKPNGNNDTLFKNSDKQLTQQELENWLDNYFKRVIKEEFYKCLNFNLITTIPHRDFSITKPSNFSDMSIVAIEQWFVNFANNRKAKIPPIRGRLFQEINEDFQWSKWLDNPNSLDIEFAKKKLDGKKAVNELISHIKNKCNCEYTPDKEKTDFSDKFKKEILKQLSSTSAIYKDLETLLLQELKIGIV